VAQQDWRAFGAGRALIDVVEAAPKKPSRRSIRIGDEARLDCRTGRRLLPSKQLAVRGR
jgi:hypothetical protein